MPVAVVTGASKGLGLALARGLARRGWSLAVDARGNEGLERAAQLIGSELTTTAGLVALAGDVADPLHRRRLVAEAAGLGGLDLLVNNASVLGPSPLPRLVAYPLDALLSVYEVNALAPLGLVQEAIGFLRQARHGRVLNITSDAAVEGYETWGGYGSSKAALEQLSAVLAVEEPELTVWAVDPGDLRTDLHQQAYPGEDISDRPAPDSVVPALLALIESDRPSGRLRAAEIQPVGAEQ